MKRLRLLFAFATVGFAALLVPAPAAVLDWNAVNWTTTFGGGSSATQTFNNVSGSGVNVTITIAGGPNTGNAELPNSGSLPNDVNTPISHNYETGREALQVDADFSNTANDYVRFTITFSKTVYGVNFQLWDIDLGNSAGVSTYQDVVQNFTVNASSVTPTFTLLGSNNADGSTAVDAQISAGTIRGIASAGSNTNLGNENDALNSGDVNVDFGTANGTTFVFEYWGGNGSGAGVSIPSNSTLQRIALYDIFFTPIPEVFSGGGALAICALAIGASLLGRQRWRTQPAG